MTNPPDCWFDLFGRPLSRRDFVRISRDVAACIALGALPIDARDAPRFRADPFIYGVASGDPVPDGVVLWTRLAPDPGLPREVAVRWEVAEDERFRRVVQSGSSPAPAELGHSVHTEVTGLRPARDYWYRFLAGGQVSAVGRTRTAPAHEAATDRFRFAFISCQNYEHGYFTAFQHLAEEDLDLVVHLGDYIYERRFTSSAIVREHESGEVFTLDQYRGRYSLYKSDAALQAAHAACPWAVTTDDHEVVNNYAGAIPGAPGGGDFLLRRAAAYQAFYEFMPLRRSSLPSGPAMQIFRRLTFGRLLDLHVLDTRQYRTDQPCGDGTKPRCAEALASTQTMMGDAQERWLERNLRESRAQWNALANQVMVAQLRRGTPESPTYSMDKWDGYVAARERLLRVLADAPPSNPVVITGDVHSNWVADLKINFDDPASPIVATEFVGTSMTSGGDGFDGSAAAIQSLNPHVKFFNSRRGYVRADVTRRAWRSDYRVLPYVSRPGAPIETGASFVVESGRKGVMRG
ncbi:MAG TPA: alkaline phosphatase D family protein [Vicinamibacterales bacterium]|nr:alkaline phosphatase D family protein [Vicinamibacterales bacterium]